MKSYIGVKLVKAEKRTAITAITITGGQNHVSIFK